MRFAQVGKKAAVAAFTITEAVVALSIVGISLGAIVLTLSQLNQEASVSRNATGAGAIIQNQIDLILSDGPFNPQKTGDDGNLQIPPELVVGTHVTNNVPIYQEPNTGIIVSGTLKTIVEDVSQTFSGINMVIYRATVSVTYTYRSRSYTASRSTLRTSDI
jgi:type II secretory pathway pseudopilin PulG